MKKIQVRVKPNSRERAFEELSDGTWVAHVKSPPADGQANDELVALVAKHFRVPKPQISIESGRTTRTKILQIKDESTR
jgi:uncharacterized protein (TIGR00251 family)